MNTLIDNVYTIKPGASSICFQLENTLDGDLSIKMQIRSDFEDCCDNSVSLFDQYKEAFDPEKSDIENYSEIVIFVAQDYYEKMCKFAGKTPNVDWSNNKTIDVVLWNYVITSMFLDFAILDRQCLPGRNDFQELLLRCYRYASGNFMKC